MSFIRGTWNRDLSNTNIESRRFINGSAAKPKIPCRVGLLRQNL